MRKATTESRRSSQSHRVPLIAGAVTSLVLTVAIACAPRSAGLDLANERAPFDPGAAMQDVKWNEERVARDPQGAIGWSQLSASYLTLSRQTDDNSYAVKAEAAARRSLELRRSNNVNAAIRLAKSILEQHRFSDALTAADDAVKMGAGDVSAQGLRAEILVEMGRYDEAWKAFDQHNLGRSGLSGYVLRARLLEVDGKPDESEVMLREAVAEADADWDLSREAAAWCHLKLGNLLWSEGKVDDAEAQYKIAVDLNPRDFKSLGGLAKVAAARQDFDKATRLAEQSVEILPSVEVASLLEDIAESRGDKEAAAKYATMVDKIAHPELYKFLTDPTASVSETKPHTHDRLYAVYCADHQKDLTGALAAAKKDLDARQDVFAYDTLAWVLHQMGRDQEALPLIKKALSRGTLDAKMLYHKGMIEAALGMPSEARASLTLALKINPEFQLVHADLARAELAKLGGER